MPVPFKCHWCDKPTTNEPGVCMNCEQRYEEGNKDMLGTVLELENKVKSLEKGLKRILNCCSLKNAFTLSSDDTAFANDIKRIAQSSIDGEQT